MVQLICFEIVRIVSGRVVAQVPVARQIRSAETRAREASECLAELEVTRGQYNFVGDVPNVIEFYSESNTGDQVEQFGLTANIFNEKRGKPVVERFLNLTKTLFSRLELTMPDGLITAISQEQTKTFKMDYGTINVNYLGSYKFGYGLEVKVNARFLSVE